MSDQQNQMLEFNRRVIEDFRATHGQMSGDMVGRRLILLTTTGARSGQPRTTVLGYGRVGDDYVVIASNNAAPNHPAWFHNLQRHPQATVEIGGDSISVRAEVARPEDRERYAAAIPWFQSQQAQTSREIPVVLLHPED